VADVDMSAVTVLMYHALASEEGRCEDADPHYAVAVESFERQLDVAVSCGYRLSSVEALLLAPATAGFVALTFDDGHASNARAVEAIVARGGTADLFVNPSRVGSAHHLGWADLERLSSSGISIQSHGQTHRYLDQLTARQVEEELFRSKREIEDRLGRPVTLFAPPGGRMAPGLLDTAHRLGYQALCSSRAGVWRRGRHASNMVEIPRMAVLATTSDAQLRRWITQSPAELARQALRSELLGCAKRLLGNRRYERLRGARAGRCGLIADGLPERPCCFKPSSSCALPALSTRTPVIRCCCSYGPGCVRERSCGRIASRR
jgi:peptidoglycan/xylan/chitin deacetylase (PgdA/CDA1 family)